MRFVCATGRIAVRCISSGENSKNPCIHRPVTIVRPHRRGGRVVEGAPLLREYTSKAYRGFESHLLRHPDLLIAHRSLVSGRESCSLSWLGRATKKSLCLKRENRLRESPPALQPPAGAKADRCTSGYASGNHESPARAAFCRKSVTNVSQSACPILCWSDLSLRKIRVFLTKHKGNRGRLPDLCPFSNRMSGRLPQITHPSKLVIA